MHPSATDIAAAYFLDDVSSATITGSRLHGILQRIGAHRSLTLFQREFLRERGHNALLLLALGELNTKDFPAQAQAEREGRLKARVAAEEREAAERSLREEATRKKNASLFEKREKALERRRCSKQKYDKRLMRIRRLVADGNPIGKDDLLWLGSSGSAYWTEKLRKAHHRNLARDFADAWRRTGDAWQAVNACAQWRKAGAPERGLDIAGEALDRSTDRKLRSAALTTQGGALRDLRRLHEAMQSGTEAHFLTPDDFRPCTLLGAVHIEMGNYAAGAEWYEKAEARGASQQTIDLQLQSILDAAPRAERDRIKEALKDRNAYRYRRL